MALLLWGVGHEAKYVQSVSFPTLNWQITGKIYIFFTFAKCARNGHCTSMFYLLEKLVVISQDSLKTVNDVRPKLFLSIVSLKRLHCNTVINELLVSEM